MSKKGLIFFIGCPTFILKTVLKDTETQRYTFNYLYIIFLVLTTYFHIETICAYINQLHGKSKENIVSFKDKKISERIKLLLDEFMQYIKNPIKIIK